MMMMMMNEKLVSFFLLLLQESVVTHTYYSLFGQEGKRALLLFLHKTNK